MVYYLYELMLNVFCVCTSGLSGRSLSRQVITDMVLDTSLEAVLVRSKRAVLQTILHSGDMQAAFRAYEVIFSI